MASPESSSPPDASPSEPTVSLSTAPSAGEDPVPQLTLPGGPPVTLRDLEGAVRVLDAVVRLYGPKKKKKRGKRSRNGKGRKRSKGDGYEQDGAADGGDAEGDDGDGDEEGDEDDDDRLRGYQHPALRPLRRSLVSAYSSVQSRFMFGNGTHADLDAYRQKKREQKESTARGARDAALQRQYVEGTALRRGRTEKLREMLADGRLEEEEREAMRLMVPDGAVEDGRGPALLEDGGRGGGVALLEHGPAPTLPKPKSCYSCKIRFTQIHHFYDQLCPPCATLNYARRNAHAAADLAGRIAVVTGARVKIGFRVCLMLLRAGCTVVATTRFPHRACKVYSEQPDFDTFKHRLHVYGLDLRDVAGLEAFCMFLRANYQKVDILINNACQTIRRPAGYYKPAVEDEQKLFREADADHLHLLKGSAAFERTRPLLTAGTDADGARGPDLLSAAGTAHAPPDAAGLSRSALLSQLPVLPEDATLDRATLPAGLSDVNGQQLDLRTENSWRLKMEQVSTPEVVETFTVNAVAPFVLNSRLVPLLTAGGDARPDRYIVNVSAMEGKFYRFKTPHHPHTNMAKAALNMLTRTSADHLATEHRIYMNSVDTGWINDENPREVASRIARENRFQTPLDEIDAAARILDPVFGGITHGRRDYGKFYKDYKETEW